MNTKTYRVIFWLLSFFVLAILSLQGFWMHNLYQQRKAKFDADVYDALHFIVAKMEERELVRSLNEQTLVIEKGDHVKYSSKKGKSSISISRTPSINFSRIRKIDKERKIQIMNSSDTAVLLQQSDDHKNINVIEVTRSSDSINTDLNSIDSLVQKMLAEIKMKTKEAELDSIPVLIKAALNNQGIFLPFEYSIKQGSAKNSKLLSQSKSFKNDLPSFSTDLSANMVFSDHRILFLQFPTNGLYVFSGMRNSLLLSLFFSLLILALFFFTMRLILKQKKISEIKNDFVNNMTHELKTPIATISLALDAISNPIIKNDAVKFSDYSRILKEENQKLNKHVERVLQMSLLEKGGLQLHRSNFDLNVLIRDVLRSFHLQIEQQKADVIFIPEEDPCFIDADKEHLGSVVNNLLDNALKYSSQSCKVSCFTARKDSQIIFGITDNGIGISREQQQKIFDKFYRVQGGDLHDIKGFGLGLSYVRSIVEMHGGEIRLQSDLHKGSTFTIHLPAT